MPRSARTAPRVAAACTLLATTAAAQCPTGATSLCIPLDSSFQVVEMTDAPPGDPCRRSDDGSSVALPLGFGFDFYGTVYTSVHVNANGNLTFEQPSAAFDPAPFPAPCPPRIAPFWADADSNPPGGTVWYRADPGRFVVVWDHVGYFDGHVDKVNTFQVILSDGDDPIVGIGRNVRFCWDDMQWTSGDSAGGSLGFGGKPAVVGANRGDGLTGHLYGLFGAPGSAYDGPLGAADGVDFLDFTTFAFDASTGAGPTPQPSAACLAERALVSVSKDDGFLRQLDPATGRTLSAFPLGNVANEICAEPGFTGLATDPLAGLLYGLRKKGGNKRDLVRIDPTTGWLTNVGTLDDAYAALAFASDGTLYAVTGDGAALPETLYSVDPATAVATFLATLGAGDDGEALAFDVDTQLLYHASGRTTLAFESIDPPTLAMQPITVSGPALGAEARALVYDPDARSFTWAGGQQLFAVTSGGDSTLLGPLDHVSKGLAFAGGGLVASERSISVSAGGAQSMTICAGATHAGRPYVVLGSFSGTRPPLAVDAVLLPLVPDAYTYAALALANGPPFGGFFGVLDGAGGASAQLALPPLAAPALVGLIASHAVLAASVAAPPYGAVFASNAVGVRFVP